MLFAAGLLALILGGGRHLAGHVRFVQKWGRTRAPGHDQHTLYSDVFAQYVAREPNVANWLRRVFQGRRVADLGAGIFGQHVYNLAVEYGAAEYWGVQAHRAVVLRRSLETVVDARCPATVYEQDMLDFLRDQPGDSLTLVACGIDSVLLQVHPTYGCDVASEVDRVVARGGGFVRCHAEIPCSLPVGYDIGAGVVIHQKR